MRCAPYNACLLGLKNVEERSKINTPKKYLLIEDKHFEKIRWHYKHCILVVHFATSRMSARSMEQYETISNVLCRQFKDTILCHDLYSYGQNEIQQIILGAAKSSLRISEAEYTEFWSIPALPTIQ